MKVGDLRDGYGHIAYGTYYIFEIWEMTKIALVKAIDHQYKKSYENIGRIFEKLVHFELEFNY